MHVDQINTVGTTKVGVTALSFGSAPIGNFRRAFTQSEAVEMVTDAWGRGIRYFDTAPSYGNGLSEHRLGHALREFPREDLTISTKVGYVLEPGRKGKRPGGLWVDPAPFDAVFDYSYDGIMRSVEASLHRLMVDSIDIVFMHDTDRYTHGDCQPDVFKRAIEDGFAALQDLKEQGVVSAIGFGVNEAEVCVDVASVTSPDCFLLAGRYTLLEQHPLDDLLPICEERDIGVALGGAYNSGILATGAIPGAHFNYGPAPDEVLARTRAIEVVCARHDVPIAAAALQFAAAHPVVASVCIGSRSVTQQMQSVDLFERPIPTAFWADLRDSGLLRTDAPVPRPEPQIEG
jgi:D-threo-aldose 1-dehydrogenase